MRQDWATVIVIGRNEEITDAPEHEHRQIHAYTLLKRNPLVGTGLREDRPSRGRAPVKVNICIFVSTSTRSAVTAKFQIKLLQTIPCRFIALADDMSTELNCRS